MRIFRSLVREAATRKSAFPHLGASTPGPFSRSSGPKVAVYYDPNRISISQAYPFLHYSDAFRRRFGAEVKLRNVAEVIADPSKILQGADIVLAQTWFRIGDDALKRLLASLRPSSMGGVLAFLDSFAPSDIRLAATVNDHIDC